MKKMIFRLSLLIAGLLMGMADLFAMPVNVTSGDSSQTSAYNWMNDTVLTYKAGFEKNGYRQITLKDLQYMKGENARRVLSELPKDKDFVLYGKLEYDNSYVNLMRAHDAANQRYKWEKALTGIAFKMKDNKAFKKLFKRVKKIYGSGYTYMDVIDYIRVSKSVGLLMKELYGYNYTLLDSELDALKFLIDDPNWNLDLFYTMIDYYKDYTSYCDSLGKVMSKESHRWLEVGESIDLTINHSIYNKYKINLGTTTRNYTSDLGYDKKWIREDYVYTLNGDTFKLSHSWRRDWSLELENKEDKKFRESLNKFKYRVIPRYIPVDSIRGYEVDINPSDYCYFTNKGENLLYADGRNFSKMSDGRWVSFDFNCPVDARFHGYHDGVYRIGVICPKKEVHIFKKSITPPDLHKNYGGLGLKMESCDYIGAFVRADKEILPHDWSIEKRFEYYGGIGGMDHFCSVDFVDADYLLKNFSNCKLYYGFDYTNPQSPVEYKFGMNIKQDGYSSAIKRLEADANKVRQEKEKREDEEYIKKYAPIYGLSQVKTFMKCDYCPFIGMSLALFKNLYGALYPERHKYVGIDRIREDNFGNAIYEARGTWYYFYNGKLHHWVDR